LKAKYVDVLKLVAGSLLIFGAIIIVLPDVLKLVTSAGRMIILVVAIAGGALLVTLLTNYLKNLWKSARESNTSKGKKPEPEARKHAHEQPQEFN
jgi:hypothetical protein